MQLAILGRQNKLGLAELESVIGADNLLPLGTVAALLKQEVDGEKFGGVTRLAAPLVELSASNWRSASKALEQHFLSLLPHLPEGKIKVGISVFGMPVSHAELLAAGLNLKKSARKAGRSLRIIPNNGPELNSAQVLHNKLTGDLGIEFLIIKNASTLWLARTTWVQNIDDYAKRDFGRPKRDAFVGMLPPKLAQTMLNLAQVKTGEHVLDPFCGTGVVLQEAALAGFIPQGTDLSEKMVDYSRLNLEWLQQAFNVAFKTVNVEQGDATSYHWKLPIDHVVCETYLGQPLSGLPKPEILAGIMQNCNTITTKFLQNLAPQIPSGTRCTIAVPAWRVGSQFKHLALLDRIGDLGYNRLRFTHASWSDLIYHRHDQIVARELLVVIKK